MAQAQDAGVLPIITVAAPVVGPWAAAAFDQRRAAGKEHSQAHGHRLGDPRDRMRHAEHGPARRHHAWCAPRPARAVLAAHSRRKGQLQAKHPPHAKQGGGSRQQQFRLHVLDKALCHGEYSVLQRADGRRARPAVRLRRRLPTRQEARLGGRHSGQFAQAARRIGEGRLDRVYRRRSEGHGLDRLRAARDDGRLQPPSTVLSG